MLKIYPYQNDFPKRFKRKKAEIEKIIGKFGIHHIGSTAVPGLAGKGMIDIMIGFNNWAEARLAVEKLKKNGFKHIHPKEKNRIFISKKPKTEFGDTHLHLTIKNSKPYKELLAFRDYLKKNRKETINYQKLKSELEKSTHKNRVKYRQEKNGYIKKITKIALNKMR